MFYGPQFMDLILNVNVSPVNGNGSEGEGGHVDRGALHTHACITFSAVKRFIGSTTGFHNHGEGPY